MPWGSNLPVLALEQIEARMREVESRYHRLALVVGTAGSGKTDLLYKLSDKLGFPRINVNLSLSARLLEIHADRRSMYVSRIMSRIVSELNTRSVILDNTEMLFHPYLQTDPLKLFQNLSRNLTIVASWHGALEDGELVFAAPGWREYRRYPATDIAMVCL